MFAIYLKSRRIKIYSNDSFSLTKEVHKNIRNLNEQSRCTRCCCERSMKTVLPLVRENWLKAQQTLPCNIYDYTIRSLASLSNLSRWGGVSQIVATFVVKSRQQNMFFLGIQLVWTDIHSVTPFS